MLKAIFTKESSKFIKTLSSKHQRQIALKIIELRENNGKIHDEKQLKNSHYKRVDMGEYRIIYEVEGDRLYILLVGKRNDDDVYKRFKRKLSQ